jgi:aldose 1-epimerase
MVIVTMRPRITALLLLSMVAVAISSQNAEAKTKMQKQVFGKTEDGQQVDLYTLTNKHGMEVTISTYGATLQSLKVQDNKGKLDDIVLGYPNLDGYITDKAYFGATVGRYGNRIANGKFQLDGVTYTLPKNDNGQNTLHGGIKGFNKKVWTAKEISTQAAEALELTYLSKDGEEGFPGNLSVKVTYTVPAARNEIKIDYQATTDKDTVVNLTNHSYFNLSGQGNGDILQQQLTIHAARFTPVDKWLIPTGELKEVKGTPFDFNQPTAIGARIEQDDEQLKLGKGYDHNWVLDKTGTPESPFLAAEAYDPQSGRVLDVLTAEPGVQFYTGNFLDGTVTGKEGKVYKRRYAFCLETQHFPDSPNHPDFPSTELKPGKQYHTTTVFRFAVK